MRRRQFIALLAGAAVRPLASQAEQASKVFRVGLISEASLDYQDAMPGLDLVNPAVRAFVHGLHELGYVEGKNLVLDCRSAEVGRIGEIAAMLIRGKSDVIVTVGNEVAQQVKRASSAVPIVMAISHDPVGSGIVASLAHPGSNITGFTANTGPEFEAKRLQMLKEVLPEATRVAFLGTRGDWEGPEGTSVRAAARLLGVTLIHAEHTPTYYANAFALITQDRPQALFVASNTASFAGRQVIAGFAVEQRMPGMFPYRESVEAGGLMAYGVSIPDLFRRAAGHVDKILKGAKPADLPVEQPTKFELVINLKTAKALGLTAPPTLLAFADEVIE